jgi:hypothetical protein
MGHTTSDNLDQADEDILTYTVSDEALEAAAGSMKTVAEASTGLPGPGCQSCVWPFC